MNCNVTDEKLAAYQSEDMPQDAERAMSEHVATCQTCRARLEALQGLDDVLATVRREEPSAGALLAARHAIAEYTAPTTPSEVMTLAEAAEFLRITPEQMDEIMVELPAFELAGQVRIRRERLKAWIGERERAYAREVASEWIAKEPLLHFNRGVA